MRYPDGSYDDVDHLDRGLDGALVDGVPLHSDVRTRDGWLSPLTSVCDLELGVRASQWLDLLEDEEDIRYRALTAQLEAQFRLDYRG